MYIFSIEYDFALRFYYQFYRLASPDLWKKEKCNKFESDANKLQFDLLFCIWKLISRRKEPERMQIEKEINWQQLHGYRLWTVNDSETNEIELKERKKK